MSGQMRIELLGRFAVSVDGTPIPDGSWRLRKSRSVIKMLALAPGRAVHPERMQELLWPDRDAGSASNNLRQAVYHARRALGCVGGDGAALLSSSLDRCVQVGRVVRRLGKRGRGFEFVDVEYDVRSE